MYNKCGGKKKKGRKVEYDQLLLPLKNKDGTLFDYNNIIYDNNKN